MEQAEQIDRLCEIIRSARSCLFLTSAGMSADSNIPTFRDKEGYWRSFPPFKEKGLEAQDLANPWAFRNELANAWAFYEWRRRNAHENDPHEGYRVINRWMESEFEEAFIHTTNTDGLHLKSGCSADSIMEVHGSMWRLQCLRPCSDYFWSEATVPLCDLNLSTMEASNFPHCPDCNEIARPHILMFGDGDYVGHPEQDQNFFQFMRKPVELIILVGSSGAVPTNDYLALNHQRNQIPVININLDPSANSIVSTPHFLKMKAKEAFLELDHNL